jgi:hypothetical protein
VVVVVVLLWPPFTYLITPSTVDELDAINYGSINLNSEVRWGYLLVGLIMPIPSTFALITIHEFIEKMLKKEKL